MIETVGAASPRQGVGSALRAAYAARVEDIPADMLKLLAKLQ